MGIGRKEEQRRERERGETRASKLACMQPDDEKRLVWNEDKTSGFERVRNKVGQ